MVLSNHLFWNRCIEIGAGGDAIPQLAAHLVWNDPSISMQPILPVLLAQHEKQDYHSVGIVAETLEQVLAVQDKYHLPRLEVAITGQNRHMRE